MKRKARYYLVSFARGRSWHVMDSDGNIPIYDGEPYGKDKPLIWHDEDKAQEVCDRMNAAEAERAEE